jgi:hypothetical protein
MSKIDKLIIYPRIVVYKNLLKDSEKIAKMLMSSKNATEDTHYLKPWKDWKPMGNMMMIDRLDFDETDSSDQNKNNQKELLKNIYEAFETSTRDFFESYPNTEYYPDFIKTWDMSQHPWIRSNISFLRYDPTNYNYQNGRPGLAMDYHTDTHEFNTDSPGRKFIVTATMYLNDNYEGGAVSFLDEDSGSVTDYKPKAGDVTVFPSGAPYYHGIQPIFGNERYLLRMFWYYDFEGTEEWHLNKNKYGEELWKQMQDEKIKLLFDSGEYHRVVVRPGETFDPKKQKSKPFFVKEVR